MRKGGIRPENEIFLILLIVFILIFTFNNPRSVDTELSLNIRKSFGSKSAQINEELKSELLKLAETIDRKSKNHHFDGLEIIGHADTAPIRSGNRYQYNLDNELAWYLSRPDKQNAGAAYAMADRAASNTELGMVRAVVVVQYFQELKQQGTYFQKIDYFVPMSAGAMVQTDYQLDTKPSGKSDGKRRRIEFQLFSTKDRSKDDQPILYSEWIG